MATQLETTGTLERKLQMAVPVAEINKAVADRLRNLSRSVKMPGFRPGKVPMKMIEQSYGPQVHSEVLGDAVSKAFSDAVAEHQLRVAGQPRIEAGQGGSDAELAFTAVFEVFPEIQIGDPTTLEVTRVACPVGDAELQKMIDVLRKQRTRWDAVERAAQDGDRLTIDFAGTLDGTAFEGGSGTDFAFTLGEGRMLPDFETGLRGAAPGEKKTFPVTFPADYGAEHLAGKTAQFEATLKKVEAPALPEVNADFAREFGIADGDVAKLQADIRANLEREVSQRLRAMTKANVMESLAGFVQFELPQSLVQNESEALAERAREDLKQRGIPADKAASIPLDAFREQAEKRVRLGLVVAEVVKSQGLQAKPDQIRKQIEEFAQSYENPGEVVRYYFSDRDRLAEVEALVVEQNVVDWALAKAKVTDKPLAFDDLMAAR
ncbi:MAG: trigger factor [Burkholderiales bacterium]|nr:trigger factor [Burkholderiales bacterium]